MSLYEGTWIVWVIFGVVGLFSLGSAAVALWQIVHELRLARWQRDLDRQWQQ